MPRAFRWNEWNLEHATKHGVTVMEIEALVLRGRPREIGYGKLKVVGRGTGGRWLQAIYILGDDDKFYVLHARELTDGEKRRERRR